MRIVQIVPRLAPPPEGVGGYAEALAGALRGRGVETRFVVGDPTWEGLSEELAASPVAARTAGALIEELDGAAVLLHYVSYGYERRGCPLWLVEALARWRRGGRERRLVTVFHEVYATGPPWRSSFWLSPLQRKLAATLARESAALATSLELYGRLLRPWARGKKVAVLPVFSTVGEPAEAPPLGERSRRMVVFGSAGVRGRAYSRALPALAAACAALEIEEILDAGAAASPPPPAEVGGAPVRQLGVVPAPELSGLLLGSMAGFLAYPPGFLAKSTIFAAYCSHGVLPVCSWHRAAPREEPEEGRHYWRPEGARAPRDPQKIAAQARSWYAGHSLAYHAESYRELLS